MNEREIYIEALKKGTPAERAAYLDEACADNAELRRGVEELLRAEEGLGDFLELPAKPELRSTVIGPETEGSGSRIGPYKLLQQLGEGGMGVVYMAEQVEPVVRRVALKIIKPGTDTRQVIARFEAERQALALMDHPCIAKVYDAGATTSGRPYFVMELVKGVPITAYCDKHQLPVAKRLELFERVCQAVQHAHQKGIIHRDLKPSNILIAMHDGAPVPMVIDFGLAKATGQQLTEKTLFTEFGQIVGTLEYMSPEQAELNQLDIDTRTDIYSLGAVLYELLTGTPPLERARLRSAAFDDMLRIIREEEPKKPSTRLSTLQQAELSTVSKQRGVDGRKLPTLFRGELDWVVMKALDKNRARRYETANGLARDIQRFLTDEPVEARPPSSMYRLRKFTRRNKVAFITTGLVAASLVTGTAVSTWLAIRVRDAEETTRQSLEWAEQNLKRARDTVDDYFTIVGQSTLLNVPGLRPLRKELLDSAVKYYESLLQERGEDPMLLADLAASHIRVAVIYHEMDRNNDTFSHLSDAMAIVERLFRDYPENKEAHWRLVGYWKGFRDYSGSAAMPDDYLTAEQSLKTFVHNWERLAKEFPGDPVVQNDLAASQYFLMRLQTQTRKASDPSFQESVRSGLDSGRKAVAIWEELCKSRPNDPDYQANLIEGLNVLVGPLERAGRTEESVACLARAMELVEKLARDFPRVPQYRVMQIHVLEAHADQLKRAGKMDRAIDVHQRRLQLASALAAEYPTVKTYSDLMTKVLQKYSEVAPGIVSAYQKRQRVADEGRLVAQDMAREPSKREESLAMRLNQTAWTLATNPNLTARQPDRAVELATMAKGMLPWSGDIWNTLGTVRYYAGDWSGAETALYRSMELGGGYDVLSSFVIAMALSKQGNRDQARIWYEGACLMQGSFHSGDKLVARFREEASTLLASSDRASDGIVPDDLSVAKSLVELFPVYPTYELLAHIQMERGEWKTAAASYAKMIRQDDLNWFPHERRVLATLLAGDRSGYQSACAVMLRRFGESDNERARIVTVSSCNIGANSVADYASVIALAESNSKSSPKSLTLIQNWGAALYRAGKWEEAIQKLTEAEELAMEVENESDTTEVKPDWSATYQFFLAMAHYRLGHTETATNWLAKGCAASDKAFEAHRSEKPAYHWSDRAKLELLRREAEELIGVPKRAPVEAKRPA